MKKIDLKNQNGFIAILATLFIPVVMLLFYLNIRATKSSYTRTAFDNAVKQAALDTARKYISGVSVANQQTYLDRIAAVSFNNAMKGKMGITKNLIPLSISTIGYNNYRASYFDTNQEASKSSNEFYKSSLRRYEEINNAGFWEQTNLDPDADLTIDIFTKSGDNNGYVLKRSDSGSYEQRRIYYKSTEQSSNTITVSQASDSKITVTASVVIDNKRYTKSYTATAPKLSADIVIGLPVNTGAMTLDNNPYGDATWNSEYKKTPLWQMKTECRQFLKRFLSYRDCGLGLIPYGGNIVLPGRGYDVISHGSYKYSNYDAVNPTVPVAESYKFIASGTGIGVNLNNNQYELQAITQIMYRSDLESYLQGYMQTGTTKQSNIENLLYGSVTSNTKFMNTSIDTVYISSANILAGYSKFNWAIYPSPYAVYGLTEHPFELYRYFALIAPFRHNFIRSSFLYLPVMFGMSMLSNGWQKKSSYTGGTNRKKILVLLANQADLWQSREITYFGFSNDASYVPMVDGDRIDYEKGELEDAGNGYYRSKIYRSSDVDYSKGNYNKSTAKPGKFLDAYYEAVGIKCTYKDHATSGTYSLKLPKPGNLKIVLQAGGTTPCMTVYKTNPHSNITVSSVSKSCAAGSSSCDGTVIERNDAFLCYSSSSSTVFQIKCSGSRTTPVMVKTKLEGLEYSSISSSNSVPIVLREDENYVYICVNSSSNTTTSDTISISLKPISSSSEMTHHTTLGYVNTVLLSGTGSSTITATSDTRLTGNAYNAKISISANDIVPAMQLTKTCQNSAPGSAFPFYGLMYKYRDYTTVEYNSSYGNIEQAYRGIITATNISDSNLPYTLDAAGSQSGTLSKIEAVWLSSNSTSLMPSCVKDYASSDMWKTKIYKYSDYDIPDVDGDQAPAEKKKLIKNATVEDGGRWTDSSEDQKTGAYITSYDDYFLLNCRGSYCNWSLIKFEYEDVSYPFYGRIDTNEMHVIEASSVHPHGGNYGSKKAYARTDGKYYYLGNNGNLNPAYAYIVKADGGIFEEKEGYKWQFAYANRHLIGSGDSYTFNTNMNKFPYWCYGTGVKFTAYCDTNIRNTSKGTFSFSSTEITKDFNIYCTYKLYSGSDYKLLHTIVSCGSVKSGYSRSASYQKFSSITGSLRATKTRTYNAATTTLCSFSGNYTNSYSIQQYYNVIYIPRAEISANSSDNDSATIGIELHGTQIISIEWSNHLNGTEGCYACSDSSGNDAKLSNGNKAVYYEPFKRSKNARWNSVKGTYKNSNVPWSGHTTIHLKTPVNGWGQDPNDPDDPTIYNYLENVRTTRSHQDMEMIKNIASSSYDYPRYDGTFTCILENINRIPGLYGWSPDKYGDSKSHAFEFNYMNCMGRYCDIEQRYANYNPQTGYDDIKFCINASAEGYLARLGSVECTIDVNRVLMATGYQTCTATDTNGELMDNGPTWCMRKTITPKMITAFKNKFGDNGRIYVIHYRYDKNKSWSPDSWGVYKNYTASTQAELSNVLSEIFVDVEKFAGYENAKIVD